MTIVEKIRASIQAVHGDNFPVYYHDEPTLDIKADEMDFPCAFMQLLTRGNADNTSGQVREVVTAAVFFVEPQTDFDFDADENEKIIDRCKKRAFKWYAANPMDEYVTIQTVEETSRAYQRFDAILTGYGLLARIEEIEGVTNCEEPEPDEENENENEQQLIENQ